MAGRNLIDNPKVLDCTVSGKTPRSTKLSYCPLGSTEFDSYRQWLRAKGPEQLRDFLVDAGYVSDAIWHFQVVKGIKSRGTSPRISVRPGLDTRHPGRVGLQLKPGDNSTRVEGFLRPPLGISASSVYQRLGETYQAVAPVDDVDDGPDEQEQVPFVLTAPVQEQPVTEAPPATNILSQINKLERLAKLPQQMRDSQQKIAGFRDNIRDHESSIRILQGKIAMEEKAASALMDGIDPAALELLLDSMK